MCEEFRDLNEPVADSPGVEPIGPELKPIESALEALVPLPARLDRDRMLYEAGRMAGHSGRSNGRRFMWPAIAAALAAMLVVSIVARPEPRIVERIVRVPVEAPSPVARAPASDVSPGPAVAVAVVRQREPQPEPQPAMEWSGEMPYSRLRDLVLASGVDAWRAPAPQAGTARSNTQEPISHRQWRNELLGGPEAGAKPARSLNRILWPPQG